MGAVTQELLPTCSQFMDSMQLDPETVDNLDMYSHIPPILMEKCAALSVRPDTVKNLVQSMQGEFMGTSRGLGLCVFPLAAAGESPITNSLPV